jgi:uncharacterized protein (TIGR01244 family)
MLRRITEAYAVAGQLWPEDMDEVKAAGFKSLLNNRPDGEEVGQPTSEGMAVAAAAAGLAYVYIPVGRGVTEESVAAMAAALENLPKPVLAFCRSGTRSLHIYQLAVGEN